MVDIRLLCVNATFSFCATSPAAGPFIVAWFSWVGTLGATDAHISVKVKGVIGQVLAPDYLPNLGLIPVSKGIQFNHLISRIPLYNLRFSAAA